MLKKISCTILAAVFAFALSTAVIADTTMADTTMADTTITVNGTGETLVDADTAVISLGVNVRNRDVISAQAKVNETIAAVRDALEEHGIAREDINTDYINIYATDTSAASEEALKKAVEDAKAKAQVLAADPPAPKRKALFCRRDLQPCLRVFLQPQRGFRKSAVHP